MKSSFPARPYRCCRYGIAGTFIATLVFGIALSAMGARLRNDVGGTQMMEGYAKTVCTLTAVTVEQCPTNGGWATVWRRGETGGSIVKNPFALHETRDLAERSMNDFPFPPAGGGGATTTGTPIATGSVNTSTSTSSYECMCNPNYVDPYPVLNCRFNDVCFMDVNAVQYMQRVGQPYGYSGDALVIIGSFTIVTSVLGLIFTLAASGWCDCCLSSFSQEEKNVYYEAKSDKFTIDGEEK
jgi:hypothetical protein